MRILIAPSCHTELGRRIISDFRYVDDLMIAWDDLSELLEAIDDVVETLSKFGFTVKHVCSPKLIYHRSKGLLNTDERSTKDGTFTSDQYMETVFHHNYYYMEDTISINLKLNVHNKSRGAATGPPLININLEEWKVTKQSLARLVGQCFQIDGSFLDPVLISLKIFFSTCCRIQESWKQEVTDQDFVDELKAFLRVRKLTYPELKT